MMSELAIHEPRSFKVCLQLCVVRKGGRNKGGRQGEEGIQAEMQEQIKYEGAGKQAGMQGESKEG